MFRERFAGHEVFDQLDNLKALAGRELEKGAQQAETLDCTGGGCTEFEMQFSREIEVFHLAPMTGSALRVGHQTPDGGPDDVTERHGDDELCDGAPQQIGALELRI
jgi:hypothetical protein